MNISLACSFFPSNIPNLLKLSFVNSLSRTNCFSTLSYPVSTVTPQIPLFLRPPIYSTTLMELRKWHAWAKNLASSIGSTFVELDNGPDSTLLCRELKWLLEDAVTDSSHLSEMGVEETEKVSLRIGVEELYDLWKQRIEERRPFQYIVGCEHWRDLVLSVQEGVLIPRPETAQIVDLVDDAVSNNGGLRDGAWIDLGTGSGAIAIGIAKIVGSMGTVIATDASPVALSVAAYNVQRYCLKDVIELRQGSLFEPLKDMEGKISGLVSNPPYIPSKDISGLQAEVGRHEPRLALDGGCSGMDILVHLSNGAASILKQGGFFAFETNGEKQCMDLIDYIQHNTGDCFCNLNVVSDFAGIQRFVTGFRQ